MRIFYITLFFIVFFIGNTSLKLYAQCDEISFNTDSWKGHLYNRMNFTRYKSCYDEPEIFNQNFGGADDYNNYWFNGMRIKRSTFSVRYRMQSTKTGCYVADLAADDGIRLDVDGNLVFNEWIPQGTTTYTNVLMNLTGSSQLVYEYYENTGGNTVRFQNLRKLNEITSGANQTVCSGNSPTIINGSGTLLQSTRQGGNYEISRSTIYKWEVSIDGGSWQLASGTNNARNYQAPILNNGTFTDKEYRFRRTVTYKQSLPKIADKEYIDQTAIATVIVKAQIGNAGVISGLTNVDQGDSGIVYSVPAIAGATSYNWTLPSGASIVSGASTRLITMNYSINATSGNIEVYGSNSCGDGNSNSLFINVTQLPNVSLNASLSNISENGGSSIITANLSQISISDITVNIAISGSASTSDYSLSSPQIIIPAGSLSGSITLNAINDFSNEGNENLNIDISSVINGIENGTQTVSLTIIDDDVPSTDPIRVDRQSPEDNYTPDDLVQNVLVTGCLTAENVSYGGDADRGIGYFNAGSSDFPLSSGIILSTGDVSLAEGPNNSNGVSTNITDATIDADVSRLTNNGRDVQILEFDFKPAGDKLEFRYVFASEEYPEYACGGYNDVFGFILSGPGISGPFMNNGSNIALLPGSSNFVSIDNVNNAGCGDANFYVDGTGGFDTQFDGRTIVLTASADVVPCQTYHIRLIIADVGDTSYNSAVFLEAESFKSNEVVIQNGIGVENDVDVMYEGCTGSYIKFSREEDFDQELTFSLNVTGTAENGVDYLYVDQFGDQIGDGKIPSSVTLPAGSKEVVYYYKALSDSEIEGDEVLRLSFLKSCPCSAPDYYEKVVTIVDIPEIEASPTSLVSCLGALPVATITVDLKAGLDPSDYQYSLNGGAFQDNNVFTLNNPTVGSTYNLKVQDKFACRSADFEITIPGITPIEANAGSDKFMCEGDTPQLEGGGGIYYEWSCSPASGLAYLNDINASNPTVADDIPFGTYTFTLKVKESSSSSALCVDTDDMVLTVKENSHFTISTNQLEYCSGEIINLSSNIINSQAGDTYLWTPSAEVNNSIAANTSATFTLESVVAKDFSLTVTKSNGCSNTEYISGVLIHSEPTLTLKPSSNICSGGSDGQLNLDASGGTPFGSSPFYTYSWSHDASLTSSNATGLSSGSYSITVSDSKTCSTTEKFDVSQKPKPIGVFFE